MIGGTAVYFAVLICVSYSSASAITRQRATRSIDEDSLDCKELNKTDWSIDRLKNVTLDTWPWKCLNSHYDSSSLKSVIKNSSIDIFDAASKGYIGFVQYYEKKEATNLTNQNEGEETPLHLAVKNGHLNIVKYIVGKLGPDSLSVYDKKVRTPLQAVAFYGQVDIMKYLIEEVKIGARFQRRALFRKAAQGGQLLMLKYLIDDRGFFLDREDGPLLVAAGSGGNVDVLKYLIYEKNLTKIGIDERRDNNTALHEAASAGHLEMVRFLIDTLNYKTDIRNEENNTAAHLAAKKGKLPILKYLIEEKGFDINSTNEFGEYLIHVAVEEGQLDVVKYLVEQRGMSVELEDIFSRTPLHAAARAGNLEIVKYLIEEKNANVNKKDHLSQNILHEAAYGSETVDMMKYLVDDRKLTYQMNEVDGLNCTILRELVQFNKLEIIKFLVGEKHADTTILDFLGDDLLHTAARLDKFEIVKYLVEEHGSDVNLKNPSGKTAYDMAPRPELQRYLLQRMNRQNF